jgi:hypothetical protein
MERNCIVEVLYGCSCRGVSVLSLRRAHHRPRRAKLRVRNVEEQPRLRAQAQSRQVGGWTDWLFVLLF